MGNDKYNNLSWDDILPGNKQPVPVEKPDSQQPVAGITDALRYKLMHKLHYINAGDLACNYNWIAPEAIKALWVDCGSPEVKSVGALTHGQAWNLQRACWLDSFRYRSEPYMPKDIWLLNDLDRKYISWCPQIWDAMSYRQRLQWLADVETKRLRGITPHLILTDITDPYSSWKAESEYDDDGDHEGGYDKGNNSMFY
ncbi:MAG: hypothetical protein ACLQQ4_18000 [Bacteroidia bacterium]